MTKKPARRVATTDLAGLKPDPENRRRHNARNVAMIAESLRAIGAARSIVIDEDDQVLAGNGVTTAAKDAGISKLRIIETDGQEIIAVRRRGLTPTQKRDLAIYDNRSAELAEWNVEQLAADRDAGLSLGPFWTPTEQAAIFGATAIKDGLTDPDTVPALRATTITAGDLFALGPHRLLCGDSTDAAAVARVLETVAALAFTSPPYADQRAYAGAKAATPEQLARFLPACAPRVELVALNLGLVRRDGAVVRYWDRYIDAAEGAGLRLVSWNVWDQGVQGSVGKLTAPFPLAHEFIFVFAGAGPRRALNRTVPNKSAGHLRPPGDRQADGSVRHHRPVVVEVRGRLGTVITLPGEMSRRGPEKDHPARFPVALAVAYVQATTPPGATVYDPFVGSGSTLIACEQLARRCAAIELAPAYCQMTIDRWEAFTGSKATMIRGRRR